MDSILFFCGYPPCPYHNDCKSLLKNNNCVKQKVYSFILCLGKPLEGSYCNIVCVCYECINTYLNLDYILIYLEKHDAYKLFFFFPLRNEWGKKKNKLIGPEIQWKITLQSIWLYWDRKYCNRSFSCTGSSRCWIQLKEKFAWVFYSKSKCLSETKQLWRDHLP